MSYPINQIRINPSRLWWSDPRCLAVLLILASAPGPLTAAEIAADTGSAQETVSIKLKSLSALGLVVRPRVRGGWYLTWQGWQLLHPAIHPPYPLIRLPDSADCAPSSLETTIDPANCAQPAQDDSAESPVELFPTLAASPQPSLNDCADTAQKFAPEHADNNEFLIDKQAKTLKAEVKLKKDSNDLTLADPDAKNRISMGQLLAESNQLFGQPGVLLNGLPERPVEMVLGWLAQAYDRRGALRSPAALVYSQLRKGKSPMRLYRENPTRFLPREYLAAVGCTPRYSSRVENDDSSQEEDDGSVETLPHPSLLAQVNGHTILQAWEQAMDLLRDELSPASYQAYLIPTRPLYWDPPGTLVIGAGDDWTRKWLESRLASTVSRLLVGILDQTVSVTFETMA